MQDFGSGSEIVLLASSYVDHPKVVHKLDIWHVSLPEYCIYGRQ